MDEADHPVFEEEPTEVRVLKPAGFLPIYFHQTTISIPLQTPSLDEHFVITAMTQQVASIQKTMISTQKDLSKEFHKSLMNLNIKARISFNGNSERFGPSAFKDEAMWQLNVFFCRLN